MIEHRKQCMTSCKEKYANISVQKTESETLCGDYEELYCTSAMIFRNSVYTHHAGTVSNTVVLTETHAPQHFYDYCIKQAPCTKACKCWD
jgi:hypothetical protein